MTAVSLEVHITTDNQRKLLVSGIMQVINNLTWNKMYMISKSPFKHF